MPETEAAKALRGQLWDLAIKVGFIAFPILFGWIIKLEVSNALQDERIANLEAELAAGAAVQQDIATIRESLVRLETTSDATDKKVGRLYDILLSQ